jgi:putative tributyrin esterase
MALLQVNYRLQDIALNQKMYVILPEKEDVHSVDLTNIPVLYLLHGMGEDATAWLRNSRIMRLIRHTKLAVVMPETGHGWYTNTTYGLNYYDALSSGLPQKIHELFPQLSTDRDKNFVCGLSMGGYGAWKFAIGSDSFSYAASLSGALDLSQLDLDQLKTEQQKAYWRGIFGDITEFKGSPNDLLEMARNQVNRTKDLPKLFAWIGLEDDLLYEANQTAVKEVQKLGYDLKYSEAHGKHEWYYWDQQLEEVLKWLPIDYVQEERLS